jgi:hypothetical protein
MIRMRRPVGSIPTARSILMPGKGKPAGLTAALLKVPPEWVAPPRAKARGVARLKEDPLGRMFARRQLGRSEFLGGREYQQLYDATQVALVRSVDLEKTKVSGGRYYDPLTDARQHAGRKLHFADDALMHRHGAEGLTIIRDVLCERRSVEQAGRLRGADSVRDARWFGTLFRKCLSVLAVQFGFANITRRPPRPVQHNGVNGDDGPDITDPSLHAGATEVGDPALRHGRPNGGA